MSNILNKFFGSVFTEEDRSKFPTPEESKEGADMVDIEITKEIIYNKLCQLKENKAPGDDELTSKVLKECASTISEPLRILFQSTLNTGEVPTGWKIANVTPIFKKGSKAEAGNYRPVSLTSTVSKIFESLMKDHLMGYLKENNLIRRSQHGFWSRRSCLTNLLSFLEEVTEAVDGGIPMDVIYLDFAKAFDKVPHIRLMSKVRALGITGKIHRWIENWLNNRKQRVVLNGIASEWTDVKSGVPQGSVLGPLLFLIFINDIDQDVENKILKFADDTKLFGEVAENEDVERMRDDLRRLFEWSEDWQMLFNIVKCKVLHIGRNNKRAKYYLGGEQLEEVHDEKDLGVIVQENLKVERQVTSAVKKANRVLGMINRTFVNKNQEIMVKLYKSLVRPHLEYGIQAWRPHFEKDKNALEKVQRRMTRMIADLKDLPYESRLKRIGITTLETRRLRGDLIEMFKIIKGKEDIEETYFNRRIGNTRGHEFKLYKGSVRTDIRKFSFSQRSVNEWNKLTEKVLHQENVDGFKRELDSWMSSRGLI